MVARLLAALRAKMLWILLGTYALAAIAPGPGLAMRRVSLGTLEAFGGSFELSLPALLLALLLFDASLGANAAELRRLSKAPHVVGAGLAANFALPIVFTLAAALGLSFWHNHDELQALLVGLALVGAMPIAGSSTAWAQNAEGNLALSLGLVIASTLLSPITTPLALRAIAAVTSGDYSEDLGELAGGSAQLFLAIAVVLPSVLGMIAHRAIGRERLARAMPSIKLLNLGVLLALNYSNATVALPRVVAHPDVDFLVLLFAVVALLCALAFSTGHVVGRALKASVPERVSLMFGLGMNNNGSGLVLAATALSDHPNVVLTIVAYNIVQQIAAGVFDRLSMRRDPPSEAPAAAPAHA